MQTRTEQGAVAWAISLNTVPVIAVPAWLVFGDSKMETYVAAKNAGTEELRPLAERLLTNPDEGEEQITSRTSKTIETLETLASMPMMRGNAAELLVDGKNTYASIFEAIEAAEEYVLVQFYIVKADDTGGDLKDKLIAKAREGVDVYVLLDNYGSLSLPDEFFDDLRAVGAKVHYFMDISGKANRFQLNFRNHRKIVVVDGEVGFVGGHNVGDDYLGKHPTLTPWRDSHLRLSGPVVKTLQIPFAEDWHWATGEILENLNWEISDDDFRGGVEALCLATGPADPIEICSMFFLTAINEADDRIWIATPYFVPDDKMVTALQLAATRGVDVKIIIPAMNDSQLVHFSSYSYLTELVEVGVEIHRYEKGFMHQKVVVVDDDLSAIGSANFDNRSFRLNFEVTGIVHDKEFNREVSSMLETDIANSRLASAADYKEKPFHFRLVVNLARLLAPIQ